MWNRVRIALVIMLILACAGTTAQQTDGSKPSAKPTKDKDYEVFDAKWDQSRWLLDKKLYLAKGNVKFTHGDTVITSDEVTYDDNDKVKTAISPGKLTITDPECDITGSKGTAYFLKKVAVIEGNVVANFKPKPSEKETSDKESYKAKLNQPTTITCPKLEYYYRKKIVNASGGIVFKQANRTASADKANYDQNSEILTLTGNISYSEENGQSLRAPGKVTISLKKGNEWIEAPNATARFKIETGGQSEEAAPE